MGNVAPFPWLPSSLGTLLIDEIGTAPQEMQTRLLQVFNRGRFTPHLTSIEIPARGAIDVWFLVTLSPEGRERIREDLATRLEGGHQLDLPPLSDRREDIRPLALRALGAEADDDPERLFTYGALDELESLSNSMQVRGLSNLIAGLSSVTEKLPYSGAELRWVANQLGLQTLPSSRTMPIQGTTAEVSLQDRDATMPTLSECTVPSPSIPDAMQVLLAWCEARNAQFPAFMRNHDRLRGKGSKVVGGAAAAVLSFLELCVEAKSNNGQYSATRTWNFFAGVDGTKAPDARTRISPLFLIDENVSVDMLRRSDALLWLALDISSRRSEIKNLIGRLQKEEGQASRIARLSSTFGELSQ
jgi:hypothetical protein